MLQFMGRENLEDYNADLLTMLETRAAKKYSDQSGLSNKPIDIARVLAGLTLNLKTVPSSSMTPRAPALPSIASLSGATWCCLTLKRWG
jgi:hypothetical protein